MSSPTFDLQSGGPAGLPPPADGTGAPIAEGVPVVSTTVPKGWSGTADQFAAASVSGKGTGFSGVGIPSSPGGPIPPAPTAPDGPAGQQPAVKGNPWFNPSFLASFNAVMSEIMQLQKKTAYEEAQSSLKESQNILAMAETSASLTVKIGETQAAQKMVEAITSFASAGVSMVGTLQTMKNSVRAGAEVDAEQPQLQRNITAAQTNLDEKRAALALIDEPEELILAEAPPAVNPARLQAQQAVEEAQTRLTTATGKRQEAVYQKTTQINQITQMQTETMKQVIQGTNAMIQAGFSTEQAALEASKTMVEAYQNMLRNLMDNSIKARDSANSSFGSACDLLNRIVDSNMQTFSMGR